MGLEEDFSKDVARPRMPIEMPARGRDARRAGPGMIQGLITSGAYCSAELQSEIGLLPPSFVPAGGKRLFVHQQKALSRVCDRIALTLPEGFTVPAPDRDLLEALGIRLIFVPNGLTLANAVLFALNFLALGAAPVRILHGDTLITPLDPDAGDAWSLHLVSDSYQWSALGRSTAPGGAQLIDVNLNASAEPRQEVLSGYFAIDDALLFCRCLVSSQGAFVQALNAYNDRRKLKKLADAAWYDFGRLKTFFNSRRAMTTERAFNHLHIRDGIVEKTSADRFKMQAERRWFEKIDPALRLYTPAYLGPIGEDDDAQGYRLAYETLMPLNDLAVFGQLGRPAWDMVFSACDAFLEECVRQADAALPDAEKQAGGLIDLVPRKTSTRLEAFARQTGVPLNRDLAINGIPQPSLEHIVAQTVPALRGMSDRLCPAVMHGDFCFSNILFDSRSQRIKVIDQRGHVTPGAATVFGDQRYDVAKLFHSAIGRYDQIVSGYCATRRTGDAAFEFELTDLGNADNMVQAFLNAHFAEVDQLSEDIVLLGVHLFLSMLPLHAEARERQYALLCNAYRLWHFLEQPAAALH